MINIAVAYWNYQRAVEAPKPIVTSDPLPAPSAFPDYYAPNEPASEAPATPEETLQSVASEIIREYPFLDHTSPNANHKAIAAVIKTRDYYISRGVAPTYALRMAAYNVTHGADYIIISSRTDHVTKVHKRQTVENRQTKYYDDDNESPEPIQQFIQPQALPREAHLSTAVDQDKAPRKAVSRASAELACFKYHKYGPSVFEDCVQQITNEP